MSGSILVVGSVAFDSVKTPFGEVDEILGGSATYFSVASSFFAPVRVVAVVGSDFGDRHMEVFRKHKIDIEGLKRTEGRTFRWKGEYGYDLNEARTLDTQLNVFETFKPVIPEAYRSSEYVFLGNIDPELQLSVLEQIKKPRIVACDSMNFWIKGKPEAVKRTIQHVDILVINDAETRMLADEPNLVRAAGKIMDMGPKTLIVKRGEYGVLMFSGKSIFGAPAFPLEEVFDPTGAGDSFAGGFMGALAHAGQTTERVFRRCIVYGSVMASFNVEQFSLNRLTNLTHTEIEERFRQFKALTHFEEL
ncbi:MAG TPA: PfkB family carbohydrate kinase [Terriglobia bacterium]|nr:PfkB family carbohydrate kinase [Terriglobia bacterium]